MGDKPGLDYQGRNSAAETRIEASTGSMKKLSKEKTSELIARCLQGDDGAWHTLIDFIAPYIFAICSKSRLTRDESFDIFGQVSMQLINSLPRLKDPEKIFSFVGTITRREIYAFFQKVATTDHIEDEAVAAIPDLYGHTPEEDLDLLERREVLLEAMLSLSPRDYKLIHMLYFDPGQPSYKEISERLDMPVSSIGPIRGKILARLYKLLKDKKLKK